MGSNSSSSHKKENEERRNQRKLLMHRKVTVDLLEKLSRSLPKVSNSLGKTLKFESDTVNELEWQSNLLYLEKWKLWKKDEATIGNLITLLKRAGIKEDVWECLFNVSREPKNATTAMDPSDEFLISAASTNSDYLRRPCPMYRVSPIEFANECFRNIQGAVATHPSTASQICQREVPANNHAVNGIPKELMQQRTDRYPQESLLDDILRFHNRSRTQERNGEPNKSRTDKTPNIHSTIGEP